MKEQTYIEAKQEYLNSALTMRQVCAKYKTDRWTFSKNLRNDGISTRRKIIEDDTIFEKIDTEEKAYWLGFLYADGCNYYHPEQTQYSVELQLAKKDYGHLEKYRKFLKGSKPITFKESTQSFRYDIRSKKMCEDLIRLGCIPRKSLVLKFPTEDQLPKHLIHHFIRGYFDGDGHIAKGSLHQMSVGILGTYEFLSSICNMFNIPISVIKKDIRHKNNTFYILFKVGEYLKFLYYIYKDSTIYLDRKFDRYQKMLKLREYQKVCKI